MKPWLLVGALLAASPLGLEASVLPTGLDEMSAQLRRTADRLQAGQAEPRASLSMASACEDHFVADREGRRKRASSVIFADDMQRALGQVSRMEQPQALALVRELQRSGTTPEHLGWAMLLSVRSQGLSPTEAVYCNNPEAGEGRPKKWIGVSTAESRRFLLDLDAVVEKGTGLNLTALQGDRVVASATGDGPQSLLSQGGRDGGLAAKVLKAVQGASFDSWFDGSLSRAGAGAAPVSAAGAVPAGPDDRPWVLPWRGRVSADVPPPARPSASALKEGPGRMDSAFLSAFAAAEEKAYGTAFPILSRLDWGARAFQGTPTRMDPTRITIHHTQGNQTTSREATIREVRGIQQFHQGGRGWSDIGYHFLIDGEGRVVEGRPIGVQGAHVLGENSGNIGISLMGDFNHDKPTAAQVESLKRLVAYLSETYAIDPLSALATHRSLNATDCPGRNVVAMMASLKQQMRRKADELASLLTRSRGASNT